MNVFDHRERIAHRQQSALDHISNWVELYYDLVFVAAILLFSRTLEHLHLTSASGWIILVFIACWWAWLTTTVCANRYRMSGPAHYGLLLAQMVIIVLMAMEAQQSITGDSARLSFEYGLLLLIVATMFFRAERHSLTDRSFARFRFLLNAGIGAVFLAAAALGQTARLTVDLVAFAALVISSLATIHQVDAFTDEDEKHISERMAAFTLIVCGESFVGVALTISGKTIDQVDLFSLIFEFVLVFSIFTGYFVDVPRSRIFHRRFGGWTTGHLLVQMGIGGTAVGASRLIDAQSAAHLPDSEILKLTIPLILIFCGLGIIDLCTRHDRRRTLVALRLATALAFAVVGVLAWLIPWIHLQEALPLFTVVAVAQAILISNVIERSSELDSDSGDLPLTSA